MRIATERFCEHYRNNGNKPPEERVSIWLFDPHNAAQDAICEASADAFGAADPYIKEMFVVLAKTLAGRQAKLRVLKNWLWHDDFTTRLDDADWEIKMTRRLLGELCEMAA
jgi:hypothetical protein